MSRNQWRAASNFVRKIHRGKTRDYAQMYLDWKAGLRVMPPQVPRGLNPVNAQRLRWHIADML